MNIIEKAEKRVKSAFEEVERIEYVNSKKVIDAFKNYSVNEAHFASTTGYGYDDLGRDTLDKIFAEVLGSEDALVRQNISCGTHALSLCLTSLVKPNDHILCVTGRMYETLEETVGVRGDAVGSLKEIGVTYEQIELTKDGGFDFEKIEKALEKKPAIVWMQRSKGYEWRKSLLISEMEEAIKFIKDRCDAKIVVDNCYGEFVEEKEPTEVGADLMAGSLIKNLGGGIAPCGGYVAGTKECVERVVNKLYCPGLGRECGASLGINKEFYKGLFMAPSAVANAVKTAILTSAIFEDLGYEVCPTPFEKRTDIIQAIKFNDEEKMIKYIQGIQKGSPVDSNVEPQPWEMPGYGDKVIMAAGAFVSGSSIELSADAPIKEPFVAFQQGGLTYQYGKVGVEAGVKNAFGEVE